MKKFFLLILCSIILSSVSTAEEKVIFDFTEEELSNLQVRKVRGADAKTIYTIGQNENGNYLKAIANNAASGLGKEIKIDLDATPYINITRKVEKDLKGIKEKTKKGQDIANVKEGFKILHNLDVNELDGVAIMADTDNSKMTAISYYQNIFFSSQ